MLRLRVIPAAETQIRAGHPWVFSGSVREQSFSAETGELAAVYDRKNRFLALGLYDAESPIRLRILHRGKPVVVDANWWQNQFDHTLARRHGMFDENTTGYRWIHGESDGWPGLVLDRYDSVLVLKLYTAAWLPRLSQLTNLINGALQPVALVLRLSRNIQSEAKEKFTLHEGQLLRGAIQARPVFLENGLRFEAEVIRGQKTGFFLDQRDNRRLVGSLAGGRHVLNCFSFSGGFSVYAACHGARSVTDIDISAHALRSSETNFVLNSALPSVANCVQNRVQADAFDWLKQNLHLRFDLVVLDPPSLAKRETERRRAIHAYSELAYDGMALLRPKGILATCSCSAHVSADEFLDAVRRAARRLGRRFEILQTTAHPPDHPASFPEAHYLKCIYLQMGS